MLGLEYSVLDLKERKVHVHQQTVRRRHKASTKTDTSRHVYLTERAKKILKSAPSKFKGGHIFVIETVNGGPHVNSIGQNFKDADNFNRAFRKALIDKNIPIRRGYNCRHTYASLGLTRGVKPGFLASQLGHSMEMFFGRYATYIESARDAIEVGKLNETGTEMGTKINE